MVNAQPVLALVARRLRLDPRQHRSETHGHAARTHLRQAGGGAAAGVAIAHAALGGVDLGQGKGQVTVPSQRVPSQVKVRVDDSVHDGFEVQSGERRAASSQLSAVSSQRSAVSGQRSAVSGQGL